LKNGSKQIPMSRAMSGKKSLSSKLNWHSDSNNKSLNRFKLF
jgi:hypothetical protein